MRITHPAAITEAQDGLHAYLAQGFHGDMAWMADKVEWRSDPRTLWPQVRSIVLLGSNYAPSLSPLEGLKVRSNGLISAYAQAQDYHDVIKPRLKNLARFMATAFEAQVKVFVDTAPVMEKPLAQAAGMGWQGKHTVLVSRDFGNWLFLGAIFTTAELPSDVPMQENCGRCRKCLDICPTNAFPAPFQLDARRCISYLTIEHKGVIDRNLRALMGNHIYGCDDCLAVCPWNKFAKTAHDIKLTNRRDIGLLPLSHLLTLDDAQFRGLFAKTPVKRTGRDRFIRNCLIAAGNSADAALIAPVQALLTDPAALVRGAAVWALARLAPDILAQAHPLKAQEHDEGVLLEWRAEGLGSGLIK